MKEKTLKALNNILNNDIYSYNGRQQLIGKQQNPEK